MAKINTNNEWIQSGNRAHPDLKLIDQKLQYELTYPGHDRDLRRLENDHLSGNKHHYANTLHKITESQKIYVGDRSHPRLVRLDALDKLNYDDSEKDYKEAMHQHVIIKQDYRFGDIVTGMGRKQAIFDGDRSHPDLQELDAVNLSYPGWEVDVKEAMTSHVSGYNMKYSKFRMTERQRMHEGDRSHPRLEALDALKLTYDGWEADVAGVEQRHVSRDFFLAAGVDDEFRAILKHFKRKEWEFTTAVEITSSMHPVQRKIVESKWSYTGWKKDVEHVRSSYASCLFEMYLEKSEIRQMIHDNEMTKHPALIKLSQMKLSYPEWEADVKHVKTSLWERGYKLNKDDVNEKMQGMNNKQQIYIGFKNSQLKQKGKKNKVHQEEEKKNDVLGQCVVCLEEARTHVFVPCGHICVCKDCCHKVMKKNKKCPMCKQTATMVMEVFLP